MGKLKDILFKTLISLCFALPVIYIIYDKVHKYDARIDLLKNFTLATRVIDLDNDGFTEELSLGNIEKDNFYGEVWNSKALLGIVHEKANVIKNTLKIRDHDKDSLIDFSYLSFYNDTLFLKSSELQLSKNKISVIKNLNLAICPFIVEDAMPECFKSELVDVDGDTFEDYVFTMFHGPKHRCLYYYNFKSEKLVKSDNEFMVVTDFHKLNINNKNVILYTTYANGNIPKDKLMQAASKWQMDSLHSDKYFSDCSSYIGYFNENLHLVGKPKIREGFTSMIRAIPVVKEKDVIYYTCETYINEPDSLQTLKVLDQALNTICSARIALPYKNDLYHKYSKEVFQKVTIKGQDMIILCGRNDSVYELSDDLKLKFLFSDANIKEGSKVKQMDLNNDGITETIFFAPGGLVVYSNGFEDRLYIESPGSIGHNALFDATGRLESSKGFYIKTDDKKLVFLTYALNPLYKFKALFFVLSVLIIYLFISLIIKMQVRKVEREKQNLEIVIKERTAEISSQNVELGKRNNIIEEKQKEIVDSINYAKRIQQTLMANDDLLKMHLPEHFVMFMPKDIVSGDFYWASAHGNRFYLAVCDSTGHGVPGAFMSLLNMGFLSEAIKEKNIIEPHEVFNYVRQRLMESIGADGQSDGMDAILLCIDKQSKTILYAAANNEPILIRKGQIIEFPKDKMPVGKGERIDSFTLHSIAIEDDDVLYLYTDGYADQFGGPKGKKFKYKPLNESLLTVSKEDINRQKDMLVQQFVDWKGNLEQVDDVLVIGIKM